MSTIEDTKFTDADYIREIAKRYDYPQIADFRAHHARLLRIADRLSAGGGEAVAGAVSVQGEPTQQQEIEAKAREIYDGWKDTPGWVPWVENGNSHKQDEARWQAAHPKGADQ